MQCNAKSAVVTGGASGIGFATAGELLKNGVSKILILDLGTSLNATQEAELKRCNPNSSVYYSQCDVTNKARLEQVLRHDAMERLGSIDILVNSAGIIDEADPSRTLAVNLLGVIDCSMIAMDLMSKNNFGKGGCIVNIASIAGVEPIPLFAIYSASKFGVIGLTRGIGVNMVFETTGVRMTAVCAGATNTPIYMKPQTYTFPWLDASIAVQVFKLQEPSVVGRAVVQAITEGENGSIWIASHNEIKVLPVEPNAHIPRIE